MIQASVPLMKENRYGRIVNIPSGLGAFEILQGFLGLKGLTAAYRISKTMLNALTCLVAQDTAVWLATLGEDGPNGDYFRDHKPVAW
ncbi:hypothetical protein [Gorillibacterium massiliense]|uniref:hypothetical protein n=1 Tax=Gorillibacterium massiliense TaxID=1280390 RepID=UPI0004B7F8D2|nr:hypothetical protein [Gorillibacterium massiliense]